MKIKTKKWFSVILAIITTFIFWILLHITSYGMNNWKAIWELVFNTFIIFLELIVLFTITKFIIEYIIKKVK
jgi:hypothetical protein